MGCLKTLQPSDLIGTVNQTEESIELGLNLKIRGVHWFQEGRITGQEKSAEACLFIYDEFAQAVSMKSNNIGAVDRVGALFDTFQPITKDKSQNGECCNG